MSTQPNPENFPSYRKPSEQDGPRFSSDAVRQRSAGAFARDADVYDSVRPGYPPEVLNLFRGCHRIVDIGAGTGKLTESLLAPGRTVWACDPSADMARVLREKLGIPVWRGTAEATALAAGSVDAVACAQTWHWVDAAAASTELDRIVCPGGRVVLAWNTLDVHEDPWILRLARIMHSGDIQRPDFVPDVHAPWRIETTVRTTWAQELTPEQLHVLMHTRSYWLRNGEKIHDRMTHNLNWYLFEHMGFTLGQKLNIPYRTDAFVLVRDGQRI